MREWSKCRQVEHLGSIQAHTQLVHQRLILRLLRLLRLLGLLELLRLLGLLELLRLLGLLELLRLKYYWRYRVLESSGFRVTKPAGLIGPFIFFRIIKLIRVTIFN